MKASDGGVVEEVAGDHLEEIASRAKIPSAWLRTWQRQGRIPRKYRNRVALAEWELKRDRAVEESGLPSCQTLSGLQSTPDLDFDRIAAHVQDCDVCQAIDAYVRERVGEPPLGRRVQILVAIGDLVARLPRWSRPAVVGAVLVGGIVLLRALFALPAMISDPRLLLEFLGAVVMAAAAGALGGLFYAAAAPLGKLGALGEYSRWIVAVWGYLFGILFVIGRVFDDEDFANFPDGASDLVLITVMAVVFGVALKMGWNKAG